ncbi:endonuclease III-like protein 1 [Zophobas morio]|uniref:endonuclease III-like protein 1 n=1 Tax=Zophobas morio TaxID=2755281 RepID=UPI003083A9E3
MRRVKVRISEEATSKKRDKVVIEEAEDTRKLQLALLRKIRQHATAPVDKYGCEQLGRLSNTEKGFRFYVLVALLLSSQTRDEIVGAAVSRLHHIGLSPASIQGLDENVLADLIKPVGFYKKKAIYLRRICEILIEKYEGDIPNNYHDLCALPGIGPKMAYLAMAHAWNNPVGIGVDVHVHRIANRLKWVDTLHKSTDHTRMELENIIPKRFWPEINPLLVGFGQEICRPTKPLCHLCDLQALCPSAFAKGNKKV